MNGHQHRQQPSLTSSASLTSLEARRLGEAQGRARDDVRLLACVGGVGGFIIGRQAALTFLPPSAARWAVAALGTAGLVAGALALGSEAVKERAHLWDRAAWPDSVRAAVQQAEAAAAARKAAALAALQPRAVSASAAEASQQQQQQLTR